MRTHLASEGEQTVAKEVKIHKKGIASKSERVQNESAEEKRNIMRERQQQCSKRADASTKETDFACLISDAALAEELEGLQQDPLQSGLGRKGS